MAAAQPRPAGLTASSNQFRRTQRERLARRVARVAFGVVLLAIGVVMLFTPGPGWLFVFLVWGCSPANRARWPAFSIAPRWCCGQWQSGCGSGGAVLRFPVKAVAVVAVLAFVGLGSAAVWEVWT
jgi:hypothetical protein